jgi:hypothetical protein
VGAEERQNPFRRMLKALVVICATRQADLCPERVSPVLPTSITLLKRGQKGAAAMTVIEILDELAAALEPKPPREVFP